MAEDMSRKLADATKEQRAAFNKGYKHAEEKIPPTFGGLYRGEEPWYLLGYNQRMLEENKRSFRMPRSGEEFKPHQQESREDLNGYILPEGETRTTSSTGGQKGVKPERYSLVPVEPLASVARLYAFGVKKYAAHNWRLGYEWSKSYDSLFRHANASMAGEDIDPETGEPHLAGVVFHAFALMEYLFHPERYAMHDDRYKPEAIESEEEIAVRNLVEAHILPEDEARAIFSEGQAEHIMQEYQGVILTPIDEMIDYLAGMYDNWSKVTADSLRRVAKDLRQDVHRNVKSFDDFRANFPESRITGLQNIPLVGLHETEIEPRMPEFNPVGNSIQIPNVVGAVYYANDKHVIGTFPIYAMTEVRALALPGYRFASGMDEEWVFVV